MSVITSVLGNGLSVVTHHMPHVETVSLGVWVGAGSRDEQVHQNGLAHMLEHMAFKGTNARTSYQIAAEIEAAGGDMNASTSMETTAYYARVLRDDWQLALDVISDIVLDPLFAEDDLSLEKGVIIQEISAAQDTPDDLVFDMVQSLAWPDHALGRDILGTKESVKSFTREDLSLYRDRHYIVPRTVIAAAGHINHQVLVEAVSERFASLATGTASDRPIPVYSGGFAKKKRSLDQTHQVMAFPAPGYLHKDIYAAHLLAGILGGGMSSRLFQEARERRGLCYSTFAHMSAFSDTGLLQIYAGTAPETAKEFTKVASDILLTATKDVTQEELDRARAQLKASLVMSLESPSSRADQIARQYLAYGYVPDISTLLEKVQAVSVEDVSRVAQKTFSGIALSMAAVGDVSQLAKYDELAASFA